MDHPLHVPSCSRRRFLSHCALCAGGMALGARGIRADARRAARPRIRLVFCETANDSPIWPNIGYDFDARRRSMSQLLTEGCPGVEFVPARLMDDPKEADELLKSDAEVDGYLVCVQGLGWSNDITKLCATGKPTLLVDNLYGGSGMFLTRQTQIMGQGRPVDWVSSSDDQDIVSSARGFALLGEGKSATEVATAFRTARRANTPTEIDWTCEEDAVPEPDFGALESVGPSRKLLVVGGGWGGDEFRKAAHDVTGVEFVPIEFEELAAGYKNVPRDYAEYYADRWMTLAAEVVEPDRAEIVKSGAVLKAMQNLMGKHNGAVGISINCLGGFYGGHMEAYPCLGFAQLNDDGFVGGCEADQMSALTMAVMGGLVGRPGFISDPVIDTSKNQIVYAHCVAMTKAFGPDGPANPYRIRSHSEDRKGASMQSLLPAGYMTTTLEINPVSKQVLMHRAKTTGNCDSDMACRTKLRAVVKGDIEKLTEGWRMGWHRVTFYGDLKPHVVELSDRLGLELIEEA